MSKTLQELLDEGFAKSEAKQKVLWDMFKECPFFVYRDEKTMYSQREIGLYIEWLVENKVTFEPQS